MRKYRTKQPVERNNNIRDMDNNTIFHMVLKSPQHAAHAINVCYTRDIDIS